nr:zinc finger protein 629-like isoform X1 [Aedes albopictus]
MSLENCCRLCLRYLSDDTSEEGEHFSLAKNGRLQQLVSECFQIEVSDGEIVSKVCPRCIDETRLVSKIRKRIRKADFEIKQYYASLAIKDEAGFEIDPDETDEYEQIEQLEMDSDEQDDKPDLTSFEEENSAHVDDDTKTYELIEVEPLIEYEKPTIEEITNSPSETKRKTRTTPVRRIRKRPSRDPNVRKTVNHNCYICSTEFESFELLDSHLDNHVGTGSQACSFCDYPVTTVRHLNMHLRTIHFRKGKRIPCEECKKDNKTREFSSKFKLQAHIKSFHEGIVEVQEKKHVCTYCGKAFNRGTYLRLHENSHTKAILHKCKQCPFAATTRSGLIRHLRVHTAERPFKCDECDASFNQSNGLQSHKFTRHSDERPFSCEICGTSKRFKTKYILQSHMKAHEKSGTNVIGRGRGFQTLGVDIKVHVPELKCSFCPAVYRKEVFLCRHILEKHPLETVPMIPCDICKAANKNVFFLTEKERDQHVENHEKIKAAPEKERVCEDCGKVFFTSTTYHHHRQTHFSIVCKECGKSFSTNRTLRLHLLTVHLKSRPYKCDKCDSSFGQLTSLNAHMKVHQK